MSDTSEDTASTVDLKKEEMQKEDSFVAATAPVWALTVVAFVTLVTGAANTLLAKLQNRQYVPYTEECYATTPDDRREPPPSWWDEDLHGEWSCYSYFEAPLFQTLLMYFGMWWCQGIWLFEAWLSRKRGLPRPVLDLVTSRKSLAKPHCPPYMWIIPTFMDWVASTMINQAFIISHASTVQIMRNFNVVIVAFLTILYLKYALRRRHWVGVILLTVGMISTGLYGIINPDEETNIDPGLAFLGVVLALLSTTIHAFMGAYEEHLMRRYFCAPFEAVGWMGLFGLITSIIVLLITEFALSDGEKTSETFFNLGKNGTVLGAQITYLFSTCIYNGAGLCITKLASALFRTVITSARGVIVWIVDLMLGWISFDWLSFLGMACVTVGSLFYQLDQFWTSCPSVKTWCNTPVVCFKFMRNPDDPVVEKEVQTNAQDTTASEISSDEESA